MALIDEPHYSFEDLAAATRHPLALLTSIASLVPRGPRPGTDPAATSMNLRVALAIGAAAFFRSLGAGPPVVREAIRVILVAPDVPTGCIVRDGRRKPELLRAGFERDFANATRRMSIPQVCDLDSLRDRLDEALEIRGGTSPWRGTPYI